MTQPPYVATIVSPQNRPLSEVFEKDIARDVRPQSLDWLSQGEALDLFFDAKPTPLQQETLLRHATNHHVDLCIQPSETRRKDLLLADMESTLIHEELLDEMADILGFRDKVAAITARAMNKEIDFHEAVRQRVRLFKGQDESLLAQAASRITLSPGAKTLVATMKAAGATCCMVSGGYTYYTDIVKDLLGLDEAHANVLVLRDDKLTGEVVEPILDAVAKRDLLGRLTAKYQIEPARVVTVGDGSNDLPMHLSANQQGGLGIGYHAKPYVRERAPHLVSHGDLTALLYYQGYRKNAFVL